MKRKLLLGVVVLFLMSNASFGQAPNLGTTSNFALFTAAGAFSNIGASNVTGNVGTEAGAFNAFPPGILVGQKHVVDAISAQAKIDVLAAFSSFGANGAVLGTPLETYNTTGFIYAGTYHTIGAAALNGDFTLDAQGDANAIFVININGKLTLGAGFHILLKNSASLCNVYWLINGAFELGAGSVFRGTIIANGQIELLEASSLLGRGLSTSDAILLHNNIVTNVMQPTTAAITAGGVTTFCAGGNVVLSGNVDGTWSTGASTPTITVSTAGDYYVTNANACGSVTSNHISVTITPAPTASIITSGGATTFCAGGSVLLSGNIDGTWSTGATTPTITVTTAGDYYVTNTKACGSVTSNHISVTITPAPTAAIITSGGSTTFCAGGSVLLSGNIDGTWSTGATTPTITVSTGGDYYVTNTNACGSVTSNHISVTITPAPTAAIITSGGATTFCAGGSVLLSGNVDGTWSTGATTPTITVSTGGDYYVTNTNACGSVTSNHISVTITPAPNAAAGPDRAICKNESTQLGATTVAGSTYSWTSVPVGFTSTSANPTVTPLVTTTYTVVETITATGCNSTNSVVVTVHMPPATSLIYHNL
jgi:hypothetical protein